MVFLLALIFIPLLILLRKNISKRKHRRKRKRRGSRCNAPRRISKPLQCARRTGLVDILFFLQRGFCWKNLAVCVVWLSILCLFSLTYAYASMREIWAEEHDSGDPLGADPFNPPIYQEELPTPGACRDSDPRDSVPPQEVRSLDPFFFAFCKQRDLPLPSLLYAFVLFSFEDFYVCIVSFIFLFFRYRLRLIGKTLRVGMKITLLASSPQRHPPLCSQVRPMKELTWEMETTVKTKP